ncbi:MAG: PKD domain-containing protein, partial [Euryarchaeota archaeon]|nr:PKD domain-containing protein [Euryarchaeota archaeon]
DFRVFGCFTENGTLYFDATASSDPEGPLAFSWDFGDGRTGQGAVTEHVFPAAGNFAVNLTVTDSNGDSTTISQVVVVKSPPPPPPPPRKAVVPEDKTTTVNLLLGVVLLLVLLLSVVAYRGATRGRGPGAAGGGSQGATVNTASKEFSPAEEQLKGAPRH